jgi:hypothetical protein
VSSNGLEPWTLIALATDLGVHVRFGESEQTHARGAQLADETREILARFRTIPDTSIDYPVTGMAFAALGQWLLHGTEPADPDPAIRLIALARQFGYNSWFPAMTWGPLVEMSDDAAPGRLAAVLDEYDGRQGRELRAEAERVLAVVLGPTSSG